MASDHRVHPGTPFRLADHDPHDDGGVDRKDGERRLEKAVARIGALQEMLYADDRWALLTVFQAMDAAGKDGALKHVFTGVNPAGFQVFSFKTPSDEELDHDFLWRTTRCLPERGRIGVFNRSYYEEVLVVRVHPEYLQRQRVPGLGAGPVGETFWEQRLDDIAAHERHLARSGTAVCKFFLNVSREEQRQRFLERLDSDEKTWKFSLGDVKERKLWDRYMEAYEAAIARTSTEECPWYVVPADRKWYARMVVAEAIVARLEALSLRWPESDAHSAELREARAALEAEGKPR